MNTLRKERRIRKYFILNPDATLDQASVKLKIPKSTIQNNVANDIQRERKIHIVSSFSEENTFYVFNGINERKILSDNDFIVLNHEIFSSSERREIAKNGFFFKINI